MSAPPSPFAALPRTDRVLRDPRLAAVEQQLGAAATKALVRAALQRARDGVAAGDLPPSHDDVCQAVCAEAERCRARAPRSRRVINATGVLLHTNLGRAPLCRAALEALGAPGYLSLELELATGRRGGRGAFVEQALASLTGAAAALVVNNNAAAIMLALGSVASGRPVIVSRGELVEIGGGFRVPEVIARSGARLVEVGTTNRTRAADFAEALETHPDAGALLRVHPGNFKQVGFVARPSLLELVAVGRARGVPVVEDLGGGALVPLPGLTGDPLVRESVAAGADLVTFSTDKILGGPQGGVLVGTSARVAAARKDPFHRAVRPGRLPLVALEATLAHYLAGELAAVPAIAMATRTTESLRAEASGWAERLLVGGLDVQVVTVASVAGGGTYAEESLESCGLSIATDDAEGFVARLRGGAQPVLARVAEGAVVVDARTVLPGEGDALVSALLEARRPA